MSTTEEAIPLSAKGVQWEATSHFAKRHGSFKWRIENFSTFPDNENFKIRSPSFSCFSCSWALELVPFDYSDSYSDSYSDYDTRDEYCVYIASLFLTELTPNAHIPVKYKISLRDKKGLECEVQKGVYCSDFFESKTCKVWMLGRGILEEKELLPEDALTVYCELTTWKDLSIGAECLDKQIESHENDTASLVIPKGSETLLNDIEALLREQKNCDVTIQVGEETFHAHKCILAGRSSVFAAMFKQDMKENRSNIITITDIEADVLSGVLKYMYSGKVSDISVEKALEYYVAADKYDLKELRTGCADFLRRNLSMDSIFDIAVLADAHNDGMIIDSIKVFIAESPSFLSGEKWKRLIKQCPRLTSEVILALSSKLSINL